MKNTTLAFLCCSVFLAACDKSSDTTGERETSLSDKASKVTSDAADSVVDSAKESASAVMEAANEAADDAMAAGDEMKDTVVETSEAAVESVKEASATAVENTDAVIASVNTGDLSKGESIYKKNCIACHGTGAAGAPKLGDNTAWSARIAQGNAVLTRHAIEGFRGEKGYMPPKGGFMGLSDDEISVTVQYMVLQSQ